MTMLVLVALVRTTTNENTQAVRIMVWDNRRITIRDNADNVSISFGSCQAIFTDVFGMKRRAQKIVPKLLNFKQKKNGT